ncbi:MAG: hypothetical protein HFJ51_00080 [Clostridia bacterium]|nr:hypothetical protein [Clostridia bacterium]
MKNEKGISLTALLVIIVLAVFALAVIFSKNSNNEINTKSSSTISTSPSKNKSYGLGDTITFDGLELTFDSTYSFVTLVNRYSEYNGKSVIKLGVNVKNVSTEKNSLNMFYYNSFGSQGTQLKSVSAYFDDVIDYAGDLKSGASYKSYFYILYDGNGNYSIDFNNFSQEISVEFKIAK